MKNISIETEYIKLDQFIKWVGITTSGADAKLFVQNGRIKVNGYEETRRGRNLIPGDIIEIEHVRYRIEKEKK